MLRYRACNIVLTLIIIAISVILLQILCWVRFVCGTIDNTEIAIPVSMLILPLSALNFLVYYITYNFIYFGRKPVRMCLI